MILRGQIVNRQNYQGSVGGGYVIKHLHQYSKEIYEKLHESYRETIKSKDEQIALLKELLERKWYIENTNGVIKI